MGKLTVLFNQTVTQNLIDLKTWKEEYAEALEQLKTTADEQLSGIDLYTELAPRFQDVWKNVRDVNSEDAKHALRNWEILIPFGDTLGVQINTLIASETAHKAEELFMLINPKSRPEAAEREVSRRIIKIYEDHFKTFVLEALDIENEKKVNFALTKVNTGYKMYMQEYVDLGTI
jgi:hypothetical protein